jgi:hypothetical protein
MPARYSNSAGVSLSLGVFLATDHYDYDEDPNTVSATTLLKPLRQIILSSRVPDEQNQADLSQMISSRMGTAIHDGIERAWLQNYKPAMLAMGIPPKVVDRVVLNPSKEELALDPDAIPVYLEQRAYKQVGKFKVSGKFDFVGDGRVEDFKSTSTFTAMNNTNDEKYSWQGSIYRWLNPLIITKDHIAIQWIFTDWSKIRAMTDPKYPQNRIQQKLFPLKSIQETDSFVRRKLDQIERHWNTAEADLPLCSDEDLWRSAPVFKYYKNPGKTLRSTKNFETMHDARLRFIEDGNVGFIKEVPGDVTACKYCPAFGICTQKDALIQSGDLVLT